MSMKSNAESIRNGRLTSVDLLGLLCYNGFSLLIMVYFSPLDMVACKRHAEENLKISIISIIYKLGAWKSPRTFINRQEVDSNVKGQS